MTLKELQYFYSLCENPNVTQVANELNVSQSAISLAIKSLENSLDEKLFDRIGKKLILNERGRYFKDITYEYYLKLSDSKNIFHSNKLNGTIKVNASKTISNYLMPNIYYSFKKKFSEVDLEIETTNSQNIIQKILDGKIDIGLIECDCDNAEIIKEKIKDDRLLVVTSDKRQKRTTYIDSIDKEWILREVGSGTRDIFISRIEKSVNNLNIFMELNDFEEIKEVIKKNKNTISVLSKHVVKKEIEEEDLIEIDLINIDLDREFFLIYHRKKVLTNLLSKFINFVKKEMNK